MDIETLFEVYIKEIRSKQLCKLPEQENFFRRLGALLKDLEDEIEQLKARGEPDEVVAEVTEKYRNITSYVDDLCKVRRKKILSMLIHNVLTGKTSEAGYENLTPEEKEWYDEMIEKTNKHIERIKDLLKGGEKEIKEIVIVSATAPPELQEFSRVVMGLPKELVPSDAIIISEGGGAK